MINDRKIIISAAGNCWATVWPRQKLYLQELWDRLKTPARGTETQAEYLALKKSQQDRLKDVGGFVGGTLKGNRRKAEYLQGRDILTLDLDSIAPGATDAVLRAVDGLGCGYCVYSTRKHCPAAPRLRVLIPFDRTVTADEYGAISRKIAEVIDPSLKICDPTTFDASRLMYWPSCSADGEYVFRYGDKPLISVDGVLQMYADWKDYTTWPQVPGRVEHLQKLAAKQADPTEKTGVLGAFCRSYDVISAMETFIPGVYLPTPAPDRFSFAGGSTTGGAVVYDNGKYLYSHHATDPAGGRLCNAFDLTRLHIYGALDDDAKDNTPTNKLPSFMAMCKLAVSDATVSALLDRERYEEANADFKDLALPDDTNWMKRLSRNPITNAYEKTTNNILLILENDPRLAGRISLDSFSQRGIAAGPYPWAEKDDQKRVWNDNDDAGTRWYIEKIYNITGDRKIMDALSICGNKYTVDPIKDYLNTLSWDGIPRLDTLFIDYLGAVDNSYTRAVTRKALCAAVARALIPGVKFDNMTILTGPQGIGKSTVLRILGRDHFSDSLKTFEGKEACELIQGSWIIEIGELEAMARSEIGRIKQFLSQSEDIFRQAYGRRTNVYPRRCVFFGTSNNAEYLRDRTGNRRFWPVDVGVKPARKSAFVDLPGEVDQIWAEALARWQLGEPLYLMGEAEKISQEEQEIHREHSPREGLIREFAEKQVPEGWNKWELDARRRFWGEGYAFDGDLFDRDRICATEVWCEAMNGDVKMMRYTDAQEINGVLRNLPEWEPLKKAARFGRYGVQKGFQKKGVTL
ncbi:MAG: virulence-associated E family protein [Oscillospiraceae bacterium]